MTQRDDTDSRLVAHQLALALLFSEMSDRRVRAVARRCSDAASAADDHRRDWEAAERLFGAELVIRAVVAEMRQ